MQHIYRRASHNTVVLKLYIYTAVSGFYMNVKDQNSGLGLFMYAIIIFINKNTLTFPFPICILLVSFSCLIALAKTSKTILHTYRERRQPYFVTDLSVIALNFSPFNLMLAAGFCKLPSLCWVMSLVSSLGLLSWTDVGFCQSPCLCLMRWSCGFCLSVFYMVDSIYLFSYLVMLNHPLIFGRKPSWSWWIIFLMCFWIWFASILLTDFASMVIKEIILLILFLC